MIEILPHWFAHKRRDNMANKNYVDFSAAYKAINKTKKDLEKSEVIAIEEAAKFAAKELEKKTPISSESHQHAKDNIVYSKPTRGKPYSEVGFDKEVAWRIHFVEFGTIFQRPQPFIEKTIKDIESEVSTIIQKEMQRRMGL